MHQCGTATTRPSPLPPLTKPVHRYLGVEGGLGEIGGRGAFVSSFSGLHSVVEPTMAGESCVPATLLV